MIVMVAAAVLKWVHRRHQLVAAAPRATNAMAWLTVTKTDVTWSEQ